MNMPGFNAEASFYPTRNHYRVVRSCAPGGGRVVPQFSFQRWCDCSDYHCEPLDPDGTLMVCQCYQYECFYIPGVYTGHPAK
jgi:hypothetical protein